MGVQLDSPLFAPKQHVPSSSSPWQDKSRSAAIIPPGKFLGHVWPLTLFIYLLELRPRNLYTYIYMYRT